MGLTSNKQQELTKQIQTINKTSRTLVIGGNKNDYNYLKNQGFTNITINNLSKNQLKGVKGKLFDITKKPPKLEKFDLIIALDVLEHTIIPDFALLNIHALLKPRGKLVLTTPNLACLVNRVSLLFGWSLPNYAPYFFKDNPLCVVDVMPSHFFYLAHKNVCTFGQLERNLVALGFKVTCRKGFHYGAVNQSSGSYNGVRGLLNKVLPTNFKEGILLVVVKGCLVGEGVVSAYYENSLKEESK